MPPAPINLDHNATTPLLPEAAEAMREVSLRYPGNPASQHELGRQARRALEAARRRIGEILGARTEGMDADQVIFTSGGTESNNLALPGLLRAGSSPAAPQSRPGLVGAITDSGSRLLISAVEHPSVTRTADHLASRGCQMHRLGVHPNGVVRLDQLDGMLDERPQLVSVMLANNETGVLQPVQEIATRCRARGALMHTDATQAVGKIPVNFTDLGVDALTATAHKLHGPLGIGLLIVRHGVKLEPALYGGFQQGALRPGTESLSLAVGFCAALEAWQREADERRERMAALRERFERAILDDYSDAVVVGLDAARLPHTSNIAFVGLDRQALAMALDLAGVACSTGSACASGSSDPSPTLLAMGLPEEVISSSIRFSLGATTTAAEIDEAARRILAVCNRLRREK
jgi:cysteine desulfurase